MSGVSASQVYDFLMQSQFWPAAQMKAYQHQQLGFLLRHAKAHVPFYRERLDPLFRSDGSIDWENWQHIPILKRADIAQHFDALQASTLPPGHEPTALLSTSGSTGLPIKIHITHILGAIGLANDWRAHHWWNVDWSKTLVHWSGNLPENWKENIKRDYGAWGPHKVGRSYQFQRDAPLLDILDHFQQVKAKYLYAQANFPFAAALEMIKSNLYYKLDAVMTFSMANEPEYVDVVKAAFGAPLRGRYSSKESGRIAHTCEIGGHYHVCAETVFVEILDDNDQPCAPGQIGRIIVTPFLSTQQPFIRYEQGDLGSWGEKCVCGKQLPVIKEIAGRVYHLFERPNGTKFAPTVEDTLRQKIGAVYWQFAQIGKNAVEVRYKPVRERNLANEAAFANILQLTLGHNFDISFKIIKNLPQSAAGKFIKYLNEREN